MRYLLLDTCIFDKENYNFDYGFLKFIKKLNIKGEIAFLTHEVLALELKKHLQEKASAFFSFYKSARKEISCLSSAKKYKGFFNINIEEIEKELLTEYDNFFDAPHNMKLDTQNADLSEILSSYSMSQPPFGTGDKKYEFPDAIVLNSLIHTSFSSSDEIYIVSYDNDWKNFFTNKNQYKFYTDLFQLIKDIANEQDQPSFFDDAIEKWCVKNNDILLETLNDGLFFNFDFHIINDEDEIDDNRSQIISIAEANCLYFDLENEVLDFDVSFTTDVDFDLNFLDYDNAYYDRETCEYYNLERKTFRYTGQIDGFAVISAKIKHLGQGKIKIEKIKAIELFQHQIEYNIPDLDVEDITEDFDIL